MMYLSTSSRRTLNNIEGKCRRWGIFESNGTFAKAFWIAYICKTNLNHGDIKLRYNGGIGSYKRESNYNQ